MSAFGWPQWTILISSILAGFNVIHTYARDRRLSSVGVTIMVFLVIAVNLAYWAVLSAGGFW